MSRCKVIAQANGILSGDDAKFFSHVSFACTRLAVGEIVFPKNTFYKGSFYKGPDPDGFAICAECFVYLLKFNADLRLKATV